MYVCIIHLRDGILSSKEGQVEIRCLGLVEQGAVFFETPSHRFTPVTQTSGTKTVCPEYTHLVLNKIAAGEAGLQVCWKYARYLLVPVVYESDLWSTE